MAKRVLLVEDDEGMRYAMRVALERADFEVDALEDGRQAVHHLNTKASEYCCVLLDMLLPGIHGSSVLSHIARTTPNLAVIAVTGYPDRVLFADPSDRHVIKAIFPKPVDPADVAAFVKSRCSRA
jgi:DNA-binding NtrC family response regulator